VEFLGGTLFSLPAHATHVRKLLSANHIDALVYIATTGSLTSEGKNSTEDTAFTEGFRRLVHRVTTAYLSPSLQEHLARAALAHAPALSRECVHILARLFVARRAAAPLMDDALVLAMWEGYLAALQNPKEGSAERNIGLEYAELLLFTFYMLQPVGKGKVLGGALAALSSLAPAPAGGRKVQLTMSIASLTLVLNCIFKKKKKKK
jgi:hypothetical protein